MTSTVFVKPYSNPRRAAAAAAHHTWLAALDSSVAIPSLIEVLPDALVFDHVDGSHPGPGDLGRVADALGRLHAAAHTRQLHAATLDTPFLAGHGLVITDFHSPRRTVLKTLPAPLLSALGPDAAVAIYKDANLRNFLLTDTTVTIVDFDDLSLAPFGYDLAKLVVSTAMTHGRPDPEEIDHALGSYNARAGAGRTCSAPQLRTYAEIHYQLTAAYLHRNGYRHPWPHVRPWAVPRRSTSPA